MATKSNSKSKNIKRVSSNLEESTFLQQTSHFLVLSLSRLSFQAQVPKCITIVEAVGIFVEGLLQEGKNGAHGREVVGHGLPLFDIPNHFCSLLTFAEVDHVASNLILSTIVDKRKGGKICACQVI